MARPKKPQSAVEEYLVDLINAKYAKRIFQQVNTEHERLFLMAGKPPDQKEYEWMIQRALELHRTQNLSEESDEEETTDTV